MTTPIVDYHHYNTTVDNNDHSPPSIVQFDNEHFIDQHYLPNITASYLPSPSSYNLTAPFYDSTTHQDEYTWKQPITLAGTVQYNRNKLNRNRLSFIDTTGYIPFHSETTNRAVYTPKQFKRRSIGADSQIVERESETRLDLHANTIANKRINRRQNDETAWWATHREAMKNIPFYGETTNRFVYTPKQTIRRRRSDAITGLISKNSPFTTNARSTIENPIQRQQNRSDANDVYRYKHQLSSSSTNKCPANQLLKAHRLSGEYGQKPTLYNGHYWFRNV